MAETLAQFEAVLQRPRRWICAYGLQAIASIKKVNLIIFGKTGNGW